MTNDDLIAKARERWHEDSPWQCPPAVVAALLNDLSNRVYKDTCARCGQIGSHATWCEVGQALAAIREAMK